MKTGAILPLAPAFVSQPEPHLASGTTAAQPHDELELAVFPGAGTFRLYEDDGLTEAYLRGQYEWTAIETQQPDARTWTVNIAPVEGHCDALPDTRGYTVTLRGCARPARVTVNGIDVTCNYDEAKLTACITVPKQPKSQPVVVTATSAGPIVALDVPRASAPFAHFVQYSTPEEATRQLGHVILAAPTDGAPASGGVYSAEVTFTLNKGGATETRVVKIAETTTSHVIPTPFACDGIAATTWEAEVLLHWHGAVTRTHFRSAPLFPAIPAWRATLYDCDNVTLTPADVLDADGNPNPALTWQTFAQSLAQTENFRRTYFTPLWRDHWAELREGASLATYLTTTVVSPEAREAVLAFTTNSQVTVYVNGNEIAEDVEAAIDSVHGPFVHGTRFTKAITLRAGKNTLLIHCPAEGRHWPFWYFGAALLTPDGELMPGLAYPSAD